MKIGGIEIDGPNTDVLVLPRSKGNVVFTGLAIHDFDEFDKIVPVPRPPRVLKKNVTVDDMQDPGFAQQRTAYEVLRFAYMMIKTLEPSKIEWSIVKLEDPSTWLSWADELSENLSIFEQRKVIDFVHEVNTLDQGKIDEARNAFLHGLAHPKV